VCVYICIYSHSLTFSGSSHHFSDIWLRTSYFPFFNEFLYNGPAVPKHVADISRSVN
jgi:hypothetical protein